MTSPGLTGSYDRAQALGRFLSGTGLIYRIDGDTVTLSRAADPVAAEGDVIQLDQITVSTASGIATTIQDAPASITVIDSETLKAEATRDVKDVLGQVPGLTLTHSTGGKRVSFRGLPPDRTLVLIDGKRVNAGNAFNRLYQEQGIFDDIPVDAIDRIEVVRGPMSTLYGSDAEGGVINIITKKPEDVWTGAVSLDLGLADHSTTGDNKQLSGYITGAVAKNLQFSAWSKLSQQDAPEAFHYTNSEGTAKTVEGDQGARIHSYGGRLTWTPQDNVEWGAEVSGSDQEYLEPDGDHDSRNVRKYRLALTNDWDLGAGKLASSLAYETASNKTWDDDDGWEDPISYDTTVFESRYTAATMLFGRTLDYTLGGMAMYEKLNDPITTSGVTLDGSATTAALYSEGRYEVSDRLTLTGGLRLDHHDAFGSHLSPRLYGNYDLGGGLMLKAGYSQAFVAPDLRSLDPNYALSSRGNGCKPYSGPCIIYGNADLKPETSDNYEIGLNFQGERSSWELTAFYNDVKNVIGAQKTGEVDATTGYDIFERVNLDRGQTAGLEGGYTRDIRDDLRWTNSFTYIAMSKYKYDFLDTEFPVATTPKWNITSGLTWDVNADLSLMGSLTYVGKQADYITADELSDEEARAVASGQNKDPYFLVNIAASYEFSNGVKLRVGIDNLFDQQPSSTVTYREDGRLYKIGLTKSF
ncbi:TonB-dependent receptor [Pseudooceanicola sp. GBMRC 2024]|uniref:TonB-dependent receptor n=2 Tax=Pseudooceanicola albus TaxID=2692189 RepID=A0A6L7G3E6_9RHOB|nr:TonB-dependent receptor [Pseudooceanicola albus]